VPGAKYASDLTFLIARIATILGCGICSCTEPCSGRWFNNLSLPSFTDTEAHASSNIRNPFLVVLDANIALRSFRSNPLPLRQEDMELVDLAVQLVEKTFFKPLVDALNNEFLDLTITV